MILAIKQGNDFAFEQAFIQYRQKLYAYFISKTKSSDDAADLTQTVFLNLWKYRGTLNESYTLDQQLFFIARNVLVDHTRKQNRRLETNGKTFRPNDITIPARQETNIQLQHALSSLPRLSKKIFILNKLYGYSYKEIAEMLSISVKAVDNNLHKALRYLRKICLLLFILLIAIK